MKNTHQADPWASLIHTCNVLNNTPPAQLPDTIESLEGDQSCGRCADGTGSMQVLSVPTPLGPNAVPLAEGPDSTPGG